MVTCKVTMQGLMTSGPPNILSYSTEVRMIIKYHWTNCTNRWARTLQDWAGSSTVGEQFDHKDLGLRLARWNGSLSHKVKCLFSSIEGAQLRFFLLPFLASELEVLLGCGEGIHWVSVDVEVDFLEKVPEEEVPLWGMLWGYVTLMSWAASRFLDGLLQK